MQVIIGRTTTPRVSFSSLYNQCVGSLTSHSGNITEGLWDGTYGLESLSETTLILAILLNWNYLAKAAFSSRCWSLWGLNPPTVPHSGPMLSLMGQHRAEEYHFCNSMQLGSITSRCFGKWARAHPRKDGWTRERDIVHFHQSDRAGRSGSIIFFFRINFQRADAKALFDSACDRVLDFGKVENLEFLFFTS